MATPYHLDLETLRSLLGKRSATLITQIDIKGAPANGYIVLANGDMIACFLQLADGRRIEGEPAYAVLRSQTRWQVQLHLPAETTSARAGAAFAASPAASPSPASPAHVFQRKQALHPSLLEGLPIKQRLVLRTVLAMVNGQRDAAAIKKQLHLPPAVVDDALSILLALGVIE